MAPAIVLKELQPVTDSDATRRRTKAAYCCETTLTYKAQTQQLNNYVLLCTAALFGGAKGTGVMSFSVARSLGFH